MSNMNMNSEVVQSLPVFGRQNRFTDRCAKRSKSRAAACSMPQRIGQHRGQATSLKSFTSFAWIVVPF